MENKGGSKSSTNASKTTKDCGKQPRLVYAVCKNVLESVGRGSHNNKESGGAEGGMTHLCFTERLLMNGWSGRRLLQEENKQQASVNIQPQQLVKIPKKKAQFIAEIEGRGTDTFCPCVDVCLLHNT